jgi:hypothetical protein
MFSLLGRRRARVVDHVPSPEVIDPIRQALNESMEREEQLRRELAEQRAAYQSRIDEMQRQPVLDPRDWMVGLVERKQIFVDRLRAAARDLDHTRMSVSLEMFRLRGEVQQLQGMNAQLTAELDASRTEEGRLKEQNTGLLRQVEDLESTQRAWTQSHILLSDELAALRVNYGKLMLERDSLVATLMKAESAIEDGNVCPITLAPIQDPMTVRCGHTFESSAIRMWLRSSNVCPSCRMDVC